MRKKGNVIGLFAGCAMLVIILDAKNAVSVAQDGLQLCLRTVIPALFPFFVLSGMMNSSLLGQTIGWLRPFCKITRIPKGSESLLLVGFLAGYPVGAQLITQAYRDGKLSANIARRMLGFCSNAGPAFVFGMLTPLFGNPCIPWVIWIIHIAAALITGWILPGDVQKDCKLEKAEPITVSKALQNAVKNMATVCGWVIVFRIILGFCDRWFLWLFPIEMQVLLSGILELSNGCVMLNRLSLEGVRFVMAGVMLSFGGLCVGMQTITVTQDLGVGYYFPGKVLQAVLAALISSLVQPLIFPTQEQFNFLVPAMVMTVIGIAITVYMVRRKKVVAFGGEMLYNTGS